MVAGLDRFGEKFAAFGDSYVLIGGAAVFVAMEAVGLTFRATKDLDLVLQVEALDADFGRAFWEFVEVGGYEIEERTDGRPVFYRFRKPATAGYPYQLELFARKPDVIDLAAGAHLVPVPVSEDVSSLSAILVDEDYYGLVNAGKRKVGALTVLDPAYLVPLKARAWIDLTARQARGERVDSNDIKKHRNDVLRLVQLIPPTVRVALPHSVRADLAVFVERALHSGVTPSEIGIQGMSLAAVRLLLVSVYDLPSSSR